MMSDDPTVDDSVIGCKLYDKHLEGSPADSEALAALPATSKGLISTSSSSSTQLQLYCLFHCLTSRFEMIAFPIREVHDGGGSRKSL